MSDFIRKINLVPASGVKFERINWLLEDQIPERAITLLAGREGVGKSTIACDIAARATRGELDNQAKMSAVYINSEDSRAATVAPRLKAAGADMERISFLDVTLQYDDGDARGALDLPQDFRLLEDQIEQNNIGLVILDAAKSAMSGKIDGNRDDSVRQFLDPMAAIADRQNCVFLCLVHFGKQKSADSGQLILGSIAWSQVARSVLSVAKDEETGRLLMTNTKGNLAKRSVTHEAETVDAEAEDDCGNKVEVSRIQWHGESTRDARDLLRDSDDDDDNRTDCEIWLQDFLEDHLDGVLRKDVLAAAKKAGFTVDKTVQRAFKKIRGTATYTQTKPRQAVWSLVGDKPSGDTDTNRHTLQSVPTVPTGHEQGKHNVPTVQKGQLGHGDKSVPTECPNNVVVDFPAPAPAPFDAPNLSEIDRAIIQSLAPDYPMSARTLRGSVPTKLLGAVDLADRLEHLTTTGKIRSTERGYLPAERG